MIYLYIFNVFTPLHYVTSKINAVLPLRLTFSVWNRQVQSAEKQLCIALSLNLKGDTSQDMDYLYATRKAGRG